jgi:hypothetical protein
VPAKGPTSRKEREKWGTQRFFISAEGVNTKRDA